MSFAPSNPATQAKADAALKQGGVYQGHGQRTRADLPPTHLVETRPTHRKIIVKYGRKDEQWWDCETHRMVSVKGKYVIEIGEQKPVEADEFTGEQADASVTGTFPVVIPYEGLRVLLAAMHPHNMGYAESQGWVGNKVSETTCRLSFPHNQKYEGRRFLVHLPETITLECERA